MTEDIVEFLTAIVGGVGGWYLYWLLKYWLPNKIKKEEEKQ